VFGDASTWLGRESSAWARGGDHVLAEASAVFSLARIESQP
jgi:hypothetical protein